MKLAFYEVFQPDATLLDKVIVGFGTLGDKSHVEGVFSDGQWFSISPRSNGVRFKLIEPKEGNWTFLDLKMHPGTEAQIRSRCEAMPTDLKYAYVGAILSVTPVCFVLPGREFCSRLWTNLLIDVGYPLDPGCKNSPTELYKSLKHFLSR